MRTLESILRRAEWRSIDPNLAREKWKTFRHEAYGYVSSAAILREDPTVKIGKDARTVAYGVTLRPAAHRFEFSGIEVEQCPNRTPECTRLCVLETAGNARYESVGRSRNATTEFAALYPAEFLAILADDLRKAARTHRSKLRVRLNVASDVRWERVFPGLMAEVHAIATAYAKRPPAPTFYDYTKWPIAKRDESSVYALTYSVSELEASVALAEELVRSGGNAAVVLDLPRSAPMPPSWRGLPLIDGDKTDDRTTDEPGAFVGLRKKGAAIATSPFVYAPA